jgi:kynurenine 3-monooxygenase
MQTQKNSHCRLWLVGSLLAIYLRKAGHTVHLYDRSPDIRQIQFRTFNKFSNVKQGLESARWCWDIGFSSRNRNTMDKRAIHLVDKQLSKYGQEGESIYSISRGALNKRMIDLAEQAGAEFFFEQKIWDVTLSEATLHIGNGGAWEERNMISFFADGVFQNTPPCNAKVCLTIRRSFKYWLQGTKYSRKSDGSHKLE